MWKHGSSVHPLYSFACRVFSNRLGRWALGRSRCEVRVLRIQMRAVNVSTTSFVSMREVKLCSMSTHLTHNLEVQKHASPLLGHHGYTFNVKCAISVLLVPGAMDVCCTKEFGLIMIQRINRVLQS